MSHSNKGAAVVFLGPSLPWREAQRLAPGCTLLPPARQGDLWRALALRPRCIALIDGVFESQPSVWHHEITAALACGVRVVGAASMGALRAAELHPQGMEGIGQVFAWYRDGVIKDDAEVALLHAGEEHQFRPLTVPLVEVRWAALCARRQRRISAADERALVEAARGIFYQQRSWPGVLQAAELSARGRAGWARLELHGLPRIKADDARACLRLAASGRPKLSRPVQAAAVARSLHGPRASIGPSAPPPSSLVRRRRLRDADSLSPDALRPVANAAVLSALAARADASSLAEQGLRRLLLAGFARSLALRPTPAELAAAESQWLTSLGVPAAGRDLLFAASGLAEDEARALCEVLALERLALEYATRMVPDGPSAEEGLALESRLRGHWSAACRELSARGKPASSKINTAMSSPTKKRSSSLPVT